MSGGGLSINFATVRQGGSFGGIVDACLRHGITAISPWREFVTPDVAEAARIVRANGLRVTGHCRGGLFALTSSAHGWQAAIDDNLQAIDEAAELGADCLVMVVGGLPKGSKDLPAAHRMVVDGLGEILFHARAAGVPLAIEPLHPNYAAERACINTLEHALDVCDALGAGVGVAIDVYHVWWDPKLPEQILRAGRGGRILAHHICDWLVPTTDPLNDRGMMGDGIIDLPAIRAAIEAAGFSGPQEVEIFSHRWGALPIDEVLATCRARHAALAVPDVCSTALAPPLAGP